MPATISPDTVEPEGAARTNGIDARIVNPRRRLPGGRAVLGGVLVALAAAGMFAAMRPADPTPVTSYLVARRTISPGHLVTASDVISQPIDLPDSVAATALGEVDAAVGAVALTRIPSGTLLHPDYIAAGTRSAAAPMLSFAIEPARAVAGDLVSGDLIDLFVTWTTGGGEGPAAGTTERVANDLPLVEVQQPDRDALGADSDLVLSVALPDRVDATELTRAIRSGELTVVRTTGTRAAGSEATE